MKPSYFSFALLCAFLIAFVSCEKNDPDTKKGGDDTTSQHQPSNPASWSPQGHVYIYETTWENSPASDKYWVWVLNFYSKDRCVKYETPNRNLTYHECSMQTVDTLQYSVEYPHLFLYVWGSKDNPLDFKDTITLVRSNENWDYPTYTLQ